jgi:hypothetical protein
MERRSLIVEDNELLAEETADYFAGKDILFGAGKRAACKD